MSSTSPIRRLRCWASLSKRLFCPAIFGILRSRGKVVISSRKYAPAASRFSSDERVAMVSESPVQSYNFIDCFPAAYAPLSIIDAGTRGLVNQITLKVKCNRVEFSGLTDDIGQWLQDMIEKGGGGSVYRDVDVTLLDRDGSDRISHKFMQAFITRYTFPGLDAKSEEPAVEAIAFQPGYWDAILP